MNVSIFLAWLIAANFLFSDCEQRQECVLPVFFGAAVSPSQSDNETSGTASNYGERVRHVLWRFLSGLLGGVIGSILTIALMRSNDQRSPTPYNKDKNGDNAARRSVQRDG